MIVKLPYNYKPRPYQEELFKAFFLDGIKNYYWIVHRRAGKDLTSLNLLVASACQRVGTYLYLLPFAGQARKIVWEGMTSEGTRFFDRIPPEIILKSNATTLTVTLINGSKIIFGGSNNLTGVIGTNPVGIVLSEFPLHHPMTYPLLSPIILENGGWILLQGTPRGKGPAYELYETVRHNPKWYVRTLSVLETKGFDGNRIISDEMIDSERRNGVSEEMIQQEFFCSWSIGNIGAFYTEEMNAVDREDRLKPLTISRNSVWTFWDIGIADSTAIWFLQPNGGHLDMVYCYENTGKGIEHYAQVLKSVSTKFGFQYKAHYAPHDIEQREYISARSRREMAREYGINFHVVPKVSIEDGIQAVKSIFPKIRFHVEHCAGGINAMREYRRDYDEVNRVFNSKPLHNWASNYCFTGDTQVLTRYGMCQMMDLPDRGEVLTLCGWKQYENPRVTRKNALVVEVVFADGTTVKCTPDHMFLTEKGWKSSEKLEEGFEIQSSLTIYANIFQESFIEFSQIKNILVGEALFCTETFGVMHLEKFLMGVISIIKTMILRIIDYPILSAWKGENMPDILTRQIPFETGKIILEKPENLQKLGMHLQKELNGIEEMLLTQKTGQNGNERHEIVNGAKKSLIALLEQMGALRGSAPTIVKPLVIESVRKMPLREDVWCLTVPDDAHFSLSNGAIVHNCDAFRYFAVMWRDLFQRQDLTKPRQYQMFQMEFDKPVEKNPYPPHVL